MASESGDLKLLGNFGKLIELVSISSYYDGAAAIARRARINPTAKGDSVLRH